MGSPIHNGPKRVRVERFHQRPGERRATVTPSQVEAGPATGYLRRSFKFHYVCMDAHVQHVPHRSLLQECVCSCSVVSIEQLDIRSLRDFGKVRWTGEEVEVPRRVTNGPEAVIDRQHELSRSASCSFVLNNLWQRQCIFGAGLDAFSSHHIVLTHHGLITSKLLQGVDRRAACS